MTNNARAPQQKLSSGPQFRSLDGSFVHLQTAGTARRAALFAVACSSNTLTTLLLYRRLRRRRLHPRGWLAPKRLDLKRRDKSRESRVQNRLVTHTLL